MNSSNILLWLTAMLLVVISILGVRATSADLQPGYSEAFSKRLVEGHSDEFANIHEHGHILSRKKRYVTFPEGSGFSVVYCLTWGTYLQTDIFTFGATVGIGFELPNDTRPLLYGHPSAELHRRDRRDVYSKLQVLLSSKGMDGKMCVLKSVCEAAKRPLQPTSFLETILRSIFTFPLSEGENDADDSEIHREYDDAQWRGWTDENCDTKYPTCPKSFFDLAFGH